MDKREISRMLRRGLGYSHIAQKLKNVNEREVSEFVNKELPDQARPSNGRIPYVVADEAFMGKLKRIGAKELAKELGVSMSAVYRAKYRYEGR